MCPAPHVTPPPFPPSPPQDIVTASPHFNIESFVPKLRDYMRVTNPYKRQFLISWITVLDSGEPCGAGLFRVGTFRTPNVEPGHEPNTGLER